MVRDLTKVNLTLDSFAQNVFDELYRVCDKKVAAEIEQHVQEYDSDMLIHSYGDGFTVGQATDILIAGYHYHQNNLYHDRTSLR